MHITENDTIETLIDRALEEAAEARRARIRGAKTNRDRLMATGVLITADDARDNHYRILRIIEMAEEQGITQAEARKLWERQQVRYKVVGYLKDCAHLGETPEERDEREAPILAKAVGYQVGYKRACTHKRTKKYTGWQRWGGVMTCSRCGVTVQEDELRRATPSEQAGYAVRLLVALGEPVPAPVGTVDAAGHTW